MTGPIVEALRRAAGDDHVDQTSDGLPRATPTHTEAAAAVLGTAHQRGWRVRLEGRGNWMPADAPADLVVRTTGMSRMTSVSATDLVASVEAGASLSQLGNRLARHRAWLAVDPPGEGDRSIGSVAATATAGPLRYRYGPIRDHILGCTVVTGDGRVVRSGGAVVKNVAGYDLTKLHVGGFGAFGLITELHLRLRALPAADLTLLATGDRDTLTRTGRDLAAANLDVAALELLSPPLAASRGWTLAVRFAGMTSGAEAEVARAASLGQVSWTRLATDAARSFWQGAAARCAEGAVAVRLGVLPDGLDELLDLVEQELDLGRVSAGPGRGGLRWSGSARAEALIRLREQVAVREIPLTLERAPWAVLRAVGHFGAFREGAGSLTERLRASFDPKRILGAGVDGNRRT